MKDEFEGLPEFTERQPDASPSPRAQRPARPTAEVRAARLPIPVLHADVLPGPLDGSDEPAWHEAPPCSDSAAAPAEDGSRLHEAGASSDPPDAWFDAEMAQAHGGSWFDAALAAARNEGHDDAVSEAPVIEDPSATVFDAPEDHAHAPSDLEAAESARQAAWKDPLPALPAVAGQHGEPELKDAATHASFLNTSEAESMPPFDDAAEPESASVSDPGTPEFPASEPEPPLAAHEAVQDAAPRPAVHEGPAKPRVPEARKERAARAASPIVAGAPGRASMGGHSARVAEPLPGDGRVEAKRAKRADRQEVRTQDAEEQDAKGIVADAAPDAAPDKACDDAPEAVTNGQAPGHRRSPAARPPRPRKGGHVPTGVRLLDQLLNGGLPLGVPVLLQGPAFLGKEELASGVVLECLRRGTPCIVVLTQRCREDAREEFMAMEPGYADLESPELIHFVDCYSKPLGEDPTDDLTDCAEDAGDLQGLARAVERAQGMFADRPHMLVLDSVSDLAMHHDAAKVFRFLQTLIGRTSRARGTTLALLDEGMHEEQQVQMFRHLVRGAIRVRGDPGKQQILVEGLTTARNPGWIEYRLADSGLEMTGSLAGGRIR